MHEMVVLVNNQDEVIGYEEKMCAHQLGLLHRAFSVFILRRNHNHELEVLLQQREQTKYHCGGLWTNTCCSHPRAGEDITAAGVRRLAEEMGIETELHHVGHFIYRAEFENGLIEHELDHVLVGTIEDVNIEFNPLEVQDVKWYKWQDFILDLIESPHKYTPWLAQASTIITQQFAQFRNILFKEVVC